MNLGRCGAGWVRGHRACLVRVAHFVGTIQAAAVPLEIHTRATEVSVRARDHEERKSRSDFFNDVYLPVTQNCVANAVHIAAKRLAFAEWEFVKDAGSELVIEVDLRQAPICPGSSGQRPVSRTRGCACAVREAGVKGARPGVAEQSVQTMSDTLRFSLDLQRV